MRQVDLQDWQAFEQALVVLRDEYARLQTDNSGKVSSLLFRGQSNACWHLETTLERNAPRFLKAFDYYRRVHSAKSQIEAVTGNAWDIQEPPDYEKSLGDLWTSGRFEPHTYEYIAYLRHHGFPSPLLDWSRSPHIAAFFAFNHASKPSLRVAIYAFIEYVNFKSSSSNQPRIVGCGPYVRAHRRHFLQQSQYTTCTVHLSGECHYASHESVFANAHPGHDSQDLLWKFTIPATERLKVLQLLDSFNLNAFSLFGSDDSLMDSVAMRELLFHEGYL